MKKNCRNIILHHPVFKRCCSEIEKEEQDRIFCRHDIAHLLDVARLMMILNMKEKLHIDEDIIYATALLHDVGRHLQYRYGIGHEISSALIAPQILRDCDFDKKAKQKILNAIMKHRDTKTCKEKNLNGLLYRADKMSRACFCCKAEKLCNWPRSKKNLIMQY